MVIEPIDNKFFVPAEINCFCLVATLVAAGGISRVFCWTQFGEGI